MLKFTNQSRFFKTIMTTTVAFVLLGSSNALAGARDNDHHKIKPIDMQQFTRDINTMFTNRGLKEPTQHSDPKVVKELLSMDLTANERVTIHKGLMFGVQEIEAAEKEAEKQGDQAYLAELQEYKNELNENLLKFHLKPQVMKFHEPTEKGEAHQRLNEAINKLPTAKDGKKHLDQNNLAQMTEEAKKIIDKKDPITMIHYVLDMMEREGVVIDQDPNKAAFKTDSSVEAHITQLSTKTQAERELGRQTAESQVYNKAPASHVFAAVTHNIVSRLASMKLADSGLGASAGEEKNNASRGAWVSGTFGSSLQKKSGVHAGYKGGLLGATIGADIPVDENIVLGAAYSNFTSKFNYKQNRAGDKTTAKTHAFSIYGQFESDALVWSNIASYATSQVSNKYDRMGFGTISSKIKSRALGLETNLGYKIAQDNVTFIPNVGVGYTNNKDKGYMETGVAAHSLKVAPRSSQSIFGIVGAKVMTSYKMSNEVEIIPGAHISLVNDFSRKAKNVKFKYTWMNDYVSSKYIKTQAPALSYNAGVTVMAKMSNFEASVGYDFSGMKKYQSHQGSLKLKVLF